MGDFFLLYRMEDAKVSECWMVQSLLDETDDHSSCLRSLNENDGDKETMMDTPYYNVT